jgi:DivIVA domain-containing protein
VWLAVVGLSEAAPHATLHVVTADGIDPVTHDRTLSRIADRTAEIDDALWITSGALASNAVSAAGLTAEDVRSATFNKPPWGKRGYDEKSVDDFLQRAVRRLDGQGELSADDARQVCFTKPPIGKRGYNEDEVDSFLDALAATIARLDDRA